MSHGLPNGFVRLYDEEGNPVVVRLDETGSYALTVTDKNTEKVLVAMGLANERLGQILLQLASITGRGFDA